MSKPRFSIILPTYNRAHLLPATVESVMKQTFPDWELIVVDDGSKDDTQAVMKRMAEPEPRIRYFRQHNQERSAARNSGIDQARGDFICFLDSDDQWRPMHLEKLDGLIRQHGNKPALYFSGMCWNFPDRKQDVLFISPAGRNPVEYLIDNQIAPSTACLHAEILAKHRFNTMLVINEDVELFARIAAEYALIQLHEVTVDFFIHSGNTKNLNNDYILQQMKAMDIIFSQPQTAKKISGKFKRNIWKKLRHQLIQHYEQTGQRWKMIGQIVLFLILYPYEPQNKSKFVSLLYHLPGGTVLQSIIRKLK